MKHLLLNRIKFFFTSNLKLFNLFDCFQEMFDLKK
jgi:hypothetical protein